LFTDYAAAKHRIFMRQTAEDVAILNADDPIVSSWSNGLRAHVVECSVHRELDEGLFLRGGNEIVSRTEHGERVLMQRDEMILKGMHNVENVLAALAAGLACGADPGSMRETIRTFKPVEHRLEFVSEIRGVRFYNDSKATSVDATLKALEAFSQESGNVVLILGGRGKRAPYAPLGPIVKEKVSVIVLIGEDADTIESELGSLTQTRRATDMFDAVRIGFEAAKAGDVVLLAPACASFDMFKSFEHRGEVFKQAVAELRHEETAETFGSTEVAER
jgi:UDP-N-acetylmuramoylalanine--D-glutamate ligase